MQTSEKIAPLLARISAIVFKYETIAEITGERFNVFSILNLERREVLTHSRFLAEILNPEGSHGLGSVPLQKFFELIGIREFPVENAQVKCETNIGLINDQKTEGGRIDILIKSRDQKAMVAIENKIDAVDQENQLLRYYNYLKNHSADHRLLYLTLEGSGASAHSTGTSQTIPHTAISYAAEILVWLAAIHKEAANKPILRESILQYINLIKKLTNKTENEKMAQEIAQEVTKDNEALSAFFALQESLPDVVNMIFEKNKRKWEALAEEQKVLVEFEGTSIFFLNDLLRENQAKIVFSPERPDFSGYYFGIRHEYADSAEVHSTLGRAFAQEFRNSKQTPAFAAYCYWPEYSDGKALLKLLNSPEADAFHAAVANKLKTLLSILKVLN